MRRDLLTQTGIDECALVNIDEVDAALCALAAQAFARRAFHAYGDTEGGFIVVPSTSLPPEGVAGTPLSDRLVLNEILNRLPKLSAPERLMLRSSLDDLIEAHVAGAVGDVSAKGTRPSKPGR